MIYDETALSVLKRDQSLEPKKGHRMNIVAVLSSEFIGVQYQQIGRYLKRKRPFVVINELLTMT